jgi:hypothetical protein
MGRKMITNPRAGDEPSGSGMTAGLESIARMLDIHPYLLEDWDDAAARLFANDCASIVYRHHLPDLNDSARDLLHRLLNQARRLVIADRGDELEGLQRALLAGLESSTVINRSVWIVALNSMLPDPIRAAVTSTEAALLAFGGRSPRRDAILESLKRRLVSRAEEASLLGASLRLREFRVAVA